MTHKELIDRVAEQTALTKKQTDTLLKATIAAINETLNEGGTVLLQNFGTFERKELKARTILNPRSGKPMEVPAKQTVNFKMNPRLKGALKDI